MNQIQMQKIIKGVSWPLSVPNHFSHGLESLEMLVEHSDNTSHNLLEIMDLQSPCNLEIHFSNLRMYLDVQGESVRKENCSTYQQQEGS